jgi:hypothetical protein
MWPALVAYYSAHQTSVALGAAYVYAVIAGAQPPLAPNAGYLKTWLYRIFQAFAANYRRQYSPQYVADPSTTVSTTIQRTVDSPATTLIKGSP